jgi:K+-transporting ATPase KdpF subunit
VAVHEGLRQVVKEIQMDYAIAGIGSVLLFFYLIYALLKPERF